MAMVRMIRKRASVVAEEGGSRDAQDLWWSVFNESVLHGHETHGWRGLPGGQEEAACRASRGGILVYVRWTQDKTGLAPALRWPRCGAVRGGGRWGRQAAGGEVFPARVAGAAAAHVHVIGCRAFLLR